MRLGADAQALLRTWRSAGRTGPTSYESAVLQSNVSVIAAMFILARDLMAEIANERDPIGACGRSGLHRHGREVGAAQPVDEPNDPNRAEAAVPWRWTEPLLELEA